MNCKKKEFLVFCTIYIYNYRKGKIFMKKITVLLFAFILLFIPTISEAYQIDGNISKEFGYIDIINSTPSDLEFTEHNKLPLDTVMFKANFNQYIFKDWADYYSVTLGSNLINFNTSGFEIIEYDKNKYDQKKLTTGNTYLNRYYIDFLLANYLLEYSTPKKSYLVLFGYEFNKYLYKVNSGSYYNYIDNAQENIDGNINEQHVQTHIPYVGLIFNQNFTNDLKNRFIFKYSSYAYINNWSKNHYKNYINELNNNVNFKGNYYSISNDLRFKINNDFYITGGAQYKIFNTTGKGTRSYYNNSSQNQSYTLNSTIKLNGYNINLGIQYLF